MRRIAKAVLLGIGLTAIPLIASAQQVFTVNCAAGETINGALARGDTRKPLTIQASGLCTENVVIARDDVTLHGAAIYPANASQSAIHVRGSRVTITHAHVVAGVNALWVQGDMFTILNSTLEGATENGLFVSGGSATVSNSLIKSNGLAGILVRGGHVRLTGSQILDNVNGIGINAQRNASVTTVDNTISGNLEGIVLSLDSTASLDGDAIDDNAQHGLELTTDSSANLLDVTVTENGAEGIYLDTGSTATISGGTITDNAGSGILLDTGSTATISGGTIGSNDGHGVGLSSDSRAHLTDVTITQNGDASSEHGIFASFSQVSIEGGRIAQSSGRGMVLEASRADLSNAVIENNPREGIYGRAGSTVRMSGGSINNNGTGSSGGSGVSMQHHGTLYTTSPAPVITGNNGAGILLSFGSKLHVNAYMVNSYGNVGLGLDCQNGEGSYIGGMVSGGVNETNCIKY